MFSLLMEMLLCTLLSPVQCVFSLTSFLMPLILRLATPTHTSSTFFVLSPAAACCHIVFAVCVGPVSTQLTLLVNLTDMELKGGEASDSVNLMFGLNWLKWHRNCVVQTGVE